jgi:hypothetical protein
LRHYEEKLFRKNVRARVGQNLGKGTLQADYMVDISRVDYRSTWPSTPWYHYAIGRVLQQAQIPFCVQ